MRYLIVAVMALIFSTPLITPANAGFGFYKKWSFVCVSPEDTKTPSVEYNDNDYPGEAYFSYEGSSVLTIRTNRGKTVIVVPSYLICTFKGID